jgi:Fe-S-cluster containining protein
MTSSTQKQLFSCGFFGFRKGLFGGFCTLKSPLVPVFFDCQRCTACCRWPGQVRVDDREIARMAEQIGVSESVFIQRYTRIRRDRSGLALVDKANGECVFLDGNACRVQEVKPQQCRDFPNVWRAPEGHPECQAIPRRVSETEYIRLVAAATGRAEQEVPIPPCTESA